MRKYVPNDRDREIVLELAAIPNITHEKIAFCITNERTGKPITAKTLRKHFAKELETGMAVMAKITMKSFVEQIKEHVWPATRLALSNYCGLKDGDSAVANVTNTIPQGIEIKLVKGRWDEDSNGKEFWNSNPTEPAAIPPPPDTRQKPPSPIRPSPRVAEIIPPRHHSRPEPAPPPTWNSDKKHWMA